MTHAVSSCASSRAVSTACSSTTAVPLAVDPGLRAGGQAHLDAALAAAPATWNGPILGFRSLEGDTITAGRTDYFTMLATSDALSAERAALGADGPLRALAHAPGGRRSDPLRGRPSVGGRRLDPGHA